MRGCKGCKEAEQRHKKQEWPYAQERSPCSWRWCNRRSPAGFPGASLSCIAPVPAAQRELATTQSSHCEPCGLCQDASCLGLRWRMYRCVFLSFVHCQFRCSCFAGQLVPVDRTVHVTLHGMFAAAKLLTSCKMWRCEGVPEDDPKSPASPYTPSERGPLLGAKVQVKAPVHLERPRLSSFPELGQPGIAVLQPRGCKRCAGGRTLPLQS